MKKVLLLLCLIMLVGCHAIDENDFNGVWIDPSGTSEITFQDGQVNFFETVGQFVVDENQLIMTFNESKLIFEFELNEEQLTLFFSDSKIVLERQ